MKVCFWRPIVSHVPLTPEPHGIVRRYVRHKRRVRAAKIAAGWALVCTTISGSVVAIGAEKGEWWRQLVAGGQWQQDVSRIADVPHAVPEPGMLAIFGLACAVLILLSFKGRNR